MICRHCHAKKANRPRGLCWSCYYLPGVREQHPSTSKFARRGSGIGHRIHAPLPAVPTDAPAGSEAKILVLIARAHRGEQLWHPADNPTILDNGRCEGRHRNAA